MVQNSQSSVKNKLLAALPQEEYQRLLPNLEEIYLDFKQPLYKPNELIQHVHFPQNAVVSLLNVMEDGREVEVAVAGREGMVGLPLFLGADQIPGLAFAQVPGDAVRMQAEVFKDEVNQSPSLRNLLLRYTQALFNQIAQSAACNRLHSMEERCCRWLLLTQDRVGSDQFPLTQEFLAQMLGVRRASVNIVATTLQQAGLIRYSRGKMEILDRQGLEDTSCECYGIIEREFNRLFGNNNLR